MKEQIETAVPRRKFVAGERDEARKTATGHSCEPLPPIAFRSKILGEKPPSTFLTQNKNSGKFGYENGIN